MSPPCAANCPSARSNLGGARGRDRPAHTNLRSFFRANRRGQHSGRNTSGGYIRREKTKIEVLQTWRFQAGVWLASTTVEGGCSGGGPLQSHRAGCFAQCRALSMPSGVWSSPTSAARLECGELNCAVVYNESPESSVEPTTLWARPGTLRWSAMHPARAPTTNTEILRELSLVGLTPPVSRFALPCGRRPGTLLACQHLTSARSPRGLGGTDGVCGWLAAGYHYLNRFGGTPAYWYPSL